MPPGREHKILLLVAMETKGQPKRHQNRNRRGTIHLMRVWLCTASFIKFSHISTVIINISLVTSSFRYPPQLPEDGIAVSVRNVFVAILGQYQKRPKFYKSHARTTNIKQISSNNLVPNTKGTYNTANTKFRHSASDSKDIFSPKFCMRFLYPLSQLYDV